MGLQVANNNCRVQFVMNSGARFRARVKLMIIVPIGIMEPPRIALSELIMLSNDNTEVGFVESETTDGKFTNILVLMERNDVICLGRACEVVVVGASDAETAFEQLDS